ncbi:MAG TPA: PLP-dependent aspartate aminotransferase family protein [Candidatus Dormibacteraeota bacterium]
MSAGPAQPDRDRVATRVVHAGRGRGGKARALVPPILTSIVFGHGNPLAYSYGRDHNENWERLEQALSELEGGRGALAFGSGMAAIAAILEVCGVGGKVVVARDAYTGSRELLGHQAEAGRCTVELIPATDLSAVERACKGAALLLLESLGNPLLSVPDLARCAEIAHQQGALVVVDNTFATPLLVQPLSLGADAVVHSVSKYIGGHSDLMLGAVVSRSEELLARLHYHRTNSGAIPGQLETWLALRGLRTLDVRLRRQMASAAFLAERLGELTSVAQVHYPGLATHPQHDLALRQMRDGFGAMLAIELDGDAARAERVCCRCRLWTNATSLGSVESLIERRARWAGEEHVPASLLRLSVGVEDPADLLSDLTQALAEAGPPGR